MVKPRKLLIDLSNLINKKSHEGEILCLVVFKKKISNSLDEIIEEIKQWTEFLN